MQSGQRFSQLALKGRIAGFGLLAFVEIGLGFPQAEHHEDACGRDHRRDEATDQEDPDQRRGPPMGGRINAPRARIDGTQSPTKIPFVSESRKKSDTEKTNDRNAASRTRILALFMWRSDMPREYSVHTTAPAERDDPPRPADRFARMKAATYDRYGPPEVVRVSEVPTPEPGDSEVLVRVEAVAVTSGDARIRAARFPRGFAFPARLAFGLRAPRRKVLGSAFSGVIEKTGDKVTGFSPGDEVCGMNGIHMGAHAEYLAVSERRLARKPAGVSHADAAGILFGGSAALYYLRDQCAIKPGDSILINGAAGSIGTAAVQIAQVPKAKVTAVCSSRNFDLVRRLGAERVVDYNETPVTELTDRFDVVLDCVGNLDRKTGSRLATNDGFLLLPAAGLVEVVRPGGRVRSGTSPEEPADFTYLLDAIEESRLDPVTETLDGLEQITEAYRRIDSGHKTGNLVILPN